MVRGRALADLAEVVDCFAALLAQDPSSEQHQVAEAFVEGLGAAAALQVSAVVPVSCPCVCLHACCQGGLAVLCAFEIDRTHGLHLIGGGACVPACLQPPQASKQPPPRQGKGKRARAAGDGGSDGDESDAGEGDAADVDGNEEAAEGQAGGSGEAAGEGAEDGEEQTAAELRRQRVLRQTQGAGFVAFMPAQLSAVSLHECVAAGHVLCTQQLAVTAVMLESSVVLWCV